MTIFNILKKLFSKKPVSKKTEPAYYHYKSTYQQKDEYCVLSFTIGETE